MHAPTVDPVAVVRAAVMDVNGARGAVGCRTRGGRYGTWSGPQTALAALRVAGISGVSHVAAFGADVLGGSIRPWRSFVSAAQGRSADPRNEPVGPDPPRLLWQRAVLMPGVGLRTSISDGHVGAPLSGKLDITDAADAEAAITALTARGQNLINRHVGA